MSSFKDLPLVAWKTLYIYMDPESLLNASNVCLPWRRIIHDLTAPKNCNSELQDKLGKCGWFMTDHDVEKCNCISLNLGLFKFIKNVPVSCRKVCESFNFLSDGIRYFASKSRIVYCVDSDHKSISVDSLTRNKAETINMESFFEEDSVLDQDGLMLIDNTLLILEAANIDGFYRIKKIHLWDVVKAEYVTELNISEKVKIGGIAVAENGSNFAIQRVEITKNKLLVLIKNILPFGRGPFIQQTLIWKFDTEDPSAGNINFWTTIEHEREEIVFEVYMNSKIFCYPFYDRDYGAKLKVFYFDDLPNSSTKSIDEMKVDLDDLSIKLEPGDSNRLAVYDKRYKKLRVFHLDIDESDEYLKIVIDFGSIPNKELSTRKLSGFLMGNIILVHLVNHDLSFIIVTKDGNVIEGNTQKILHHVDKDSYFDVDSFGMIVFSAKRDFQSWRYTQQLHLYNL